MINCLPLFYGSYKWHCAHSSINKHQVLHVHAKAVAAYLLQTIVIKAASKSCSLQGTYFPIRTHPCTVSTHCSSARTTADKPLESSPNGNVLTLLSSCGLLARTLCAQMRSSIRILSIAHQRMLDCMLVLRISPTIVLHNPTGCRMFMYTHTM